MKVCIANMLVVVPSGITINTHDHIRNWINTSTCDKVVEPTVPFPFPISFDIQEPINYSYFVLLYNVLNNLISL